MEIPRLRGSWRGIATVFDLQQIELETLQIRSNLQHLHASETSALPNGHPPKEREGAASEIVLQILIVLLNPGFAADLSLREWETRERGGRRG
jgi:hypothetical protein